MSDSSYQDDRNSLDFAPATEFAEELEILFSQLDARAVEQFYQSYQLWTIQRRIEDLELEIEGLQQEIARNAERMRRVLPTPMALTVLVQLHATGVEDIDLLDRMLERGDSWLGSMMQLLERCEQMGIVHNDYTAWCEHALAGAYDWLDSLNEASPTSLPPLEKEPVEKEPDDSFIAQTATLLLQKLISDDEQTESLPSILLPKTRPDPVAREPLLTDIMEEPTTALVASTRPPELLIVTSNEVELDMVEANAKREEEAVPLILSSDILLAEEAHQTEDAPHIKEGRMTEEDEQQTSVEKKSASQSNFIKRSWAKIFRD